MALLSDNIVQKWILSVTDNLRYLNVKLYTIYVDNMLVSDNLCAVVLIVWQFSYLCVNYLTIYAVLTGIIVYTYWPAPVDRLYRVYVYRIYVYRIYVLTTLLKF